MAGKNKANLNLVLCFKYKIRLIYNNLANFNIKCDTKFDTKTRFLSKYHKHSIC